jgi:glycosyltransferase involved in cell wall biosynthesis
LAGKDINGQNIARGKFERRKIMMISGLKKYKGIDNFVSLAKQCPEYLFVLICSSTRKDIEEYFVDTKLTDNINILSQQNDLTTYYFDASIVINLTLPDLCVEALSMTLLEGMQFGTPCIAPDFGGPKEIIINGKNGFLINPYDEKAVIAAIKQIMNTEKAYSNFVQGALETRKRFSIDTLIRQVTILLESR